jgi:hypothetical protein
MLFGKRIINSFVGWICHQPGPIHGPDPLWHLSPCHCCMGTCAIAAHLSAALPYPRVAWQGITPKSSTRRAKCRCDSHRCSALSSQTAAPLAATVLDIHEHALGHPIFPHALLLASAAAAPAHFHHRAAAGHRDARTSGLPTSCPTLRHLPRARLGTNLSARVRIGCLHCYHLACFIRRVAVVVPHLSHLTPDTCVRTSAVQARVRSSCHQSVSVRLICSAFTHVRSS